MLYLWESGLPRKSAGVVWQTCFSLAGRIGVVEEREARKTD